MNSDVQWFLYLCIKKKIITPQLCNEIVAKVGREAEFQELLDALPNFNFSCNPEKLQMLVDEAWERAVNDEEPPALDRASSSSEAAPAPKTVKKDFSSFPDLAEAGNMAVEEIPAFFQKVIEAAMSMGASDLHIGADMPVCLRINRMLCPVSTTALPAATAEKINLSILNDEQRAAFKEGWDFDFALQFDDHRRYRSNLSMEKDGVTGVYHLIPEEIKSLAELGFSNPDTIKQLLTYHNGLILVTGPIGSGKTTTLATMVDELNKTRNDHIITIENPIEIVQESERCIVTQRQVEKHTESYQSAIKSALREDPDIIVFGELNDLETIEMAITASETGHLVIGTMHTSDCVNTLNRLLDAFPPIQQPQIRAMTSQSLRGIICQRLLPTVNDDVVLAQEILINNSAVANMIRESKEHGIKSVMQTGLRKGMILMDNSVKALYDAGEISLETAQKNIKDKHLRNSLS